MTLSAPERIALVVALAVGCYRYVTGKWPVSIEVDDR